MNIISKNSNSVALYVIATPIGNRDDISRRALECLDALSCFFAEDTRELKKLFVLQGMSTEGKKFSSFAQHNMKTAVEQAMAYLSQGVSVGLVSDRGTPAVSDPGAMLVDAALNEGIAVVPVPGPSSLTALVSVSGFLEKEFSFVGFLPVTQKERSHLFELIRKTQWPTALLESPKRIHKTLSQLKTEFPNGTLVIGRELTKKFESVTRVLLSELDPKSVPEKGEFTLLLAPGKSLEQSSEWEQEVSWRKISDKQWSKKMSEKYGVSAKRIYDELLKFKNEVD